MKLKTLLALLLVMMLGQVQAYKLQTIEITVNGTKRNMLCYTPNTMQTNMPLWIVTHGMGQDPEYQRDGDHLYELIDTEKFIVCYLRSSGSTWDIGGQGDLNFVRQTITEMHTKFGINKNRVYWSGFSMGSMLIYHGIENGMGDVIAAFAPCSGVKHGTPWVNCKKPINLIHCHGTGDDVFPIDEYKPRDYAYHFVEIDKCKTYKKTENYKPTGAYDAGTKEVWTDGINGTSVEIFMANNHGHWPSVNYTRETWNFCKQFSLATPKEEYESACKQAEELLEVWKDDIELFTSLKTTYNALTTSNESYGSGKVTTDDQTELQNATSKLQSAIDKFTSAISTNIKTSKKVSKDEFDPNFHIYLCLGESNMEGNATPELKDYAGASERFLVMSPVRMTNYTRTKGTWYVARPPLCRNTTGLGPADYFGKTMIKNMPDSITVGVINVSLSGCGIDMYNEDGLANYISQQNADLKSIAKEYSNNPFRVLVDMAKKAQEAGVIKGILLHQGCTNNGQKDWPMKVNNVYQRLLSELGLNQDEVPLLVGEVLSKANGGSYYAHNDVIATIPNVIANAFIVPSQGCSGASDGIHFSETGYRTLGANYATVMLESMQRHSKNNAFSIKELVAQETAIAMTAGTTKPLYIILTDEDGVKHDVTAACEFTCSDPDMLTFTSINMFSGNKEGDATVTATFTNDKGEKISTEFQVNVRLFPITKESFNPSILQNGTLTISTTTARWKSVKGGMGGWYYPMAIDLSGYNYLVATLKGKSAAKPTLRVYDVSDASSKNYHTESLVSKTEAIVDLKNLKDDAGNPMDASHIYIVAFTAENDNALLIQEVTVTNETPTSLDIIHDGGEEVNSNVFDLTGRKVERQHRGIFIKNGKKYVK